MSQFARHNRVYFEFHPDLCLVKSQATSEVLLQGSLGKDGLYSFGNLKAPSYSSSISPCVHPLTSGNLHSATLNSCTIHNTTAIGPSLYAQWDNRLGHPHHEVLKTVLSRCNIHIPHQSKLDFCTVCCLGKVHRLPSTHSNTQYHAPFELVFADVWGPAPMLSTAGFKYLLTCVDAFTKYTWIFLLKQKSEVTSTFTTFMAYVRTQFNCQIKTVQTDGGGEFQPLTSLLATQGIIHRLTCPHTHHQNGYVERKHRHVVETGLTLLAQASLTLKFWDHAFQAAAYLINTMPTTVLAMQSRYSTLYQSEPDYTFLKVFGCAHTPQALQPS